MKEISIVKQFLLILCLTILSISCDNTEKDWNKAKVLNTKSEYQAFILKHSTSEFVENARFAMDSLDWVAIIKTHNVDSIRQFLKNYSPSEFLRNSNTAMDSIDWNIAYYSNDSIKFREYINKYPGSSNIPRAEEAIWKIKWPPVEVGKANSIYIGAQGSGQYYGTLMFALGANSPVSTFAGGKGPINVFVWRDFGKNEIEEAKRIGLLSGKAYLQTNEGSFKFIRNVDLNKSDKELCAEFGISN
jgi:hypothetical protein